jgi:hypothetical protein
MLFDSSWKPMEGDASNVAMYTLHVAEGRRDMAVLCIILNLMLSLGIGSLSIFNMFYLNFDQSIFDEMKASNTCHGHW